MMMSDERDERSFSHKRKKAINLYTEGEGRYSWEAYFYMCV